MRFVVFSDLHLDAAFTLLGGDQGAARKRRQALRDTLDAVTNLARATNADALLCAGDLYEHERVSADTAQFLRRAFQDLAPRPVFIAPGNHDWYGPESLYHRLEWPQNVRIFRGARFEAVDLADGVTLWGAAHRAPANTPNLLADFRVDRSGVNLGLFHGAEQGWTIDDGEGPHGPFRAEDVARSGLNHAFVGHYHHRRAAERHTYPGSPTPLTFAEVGAGGAVVATVHGDGSIEREWREVGTAIHDLSLDVTGARSLQDVRQALANCVRGRKGVARVTAHGEVEPAVSLRVDDLRDVEHELDALIIRLDRVAVGYDIAAISGEATIRGEFVRDVLAADLPEDTQRRVLVTGLRALAGRDDLEVW